MKIMFISDIHGIKTNLPKIKQKFNELQCNKLVVLGDLYYNDSIRKLNDCYDNNYVKKFLESFKDNLVCIKGNCDSLDNVRTSDFPIIKELGLIRTINNDIYLTHGHIYNESNWPKENSILVYGHLHIPFIKQIETNLYLNPGSISLPRQNNNPTYLIYDEDKFVIYDIYDNIIASSNKIN